MPDSLESLSQILSGAGLKSLRVIWDSGAQEWFLGATAKLRAYIAKSYLERLELELDSSLSFTSIIFNLPSSLVVLRLEDNDLRSSSPANLARTLSGVLDAIKGKPGALRVIEYISKFWHWADEAIEIVEVFREEGLELRFGAARLEPLAVEGLEG